MAKLSNKSPPSFVIHLQKESFKFSGSHFTIFSQSRAERLHGHNFYVGLEIGTSQLNKELGMTFDFNLIKPILKKICNTLDEYVLLPRNSPFLKIQVRNKTVSVQFARRNYSFPRTEVKLLPLVNITSEELCLWILNQLSTRVPPQVKLDWIRINVQETNGQSVSCKRVFAVSTLPVPVVPVPKLVSHSRRSK